MNMIVNRQKWIQNKNNSIDAEVAIQASKK